MRFSNRNKYIFMYFIEKITSKLTNPKYLGAHPSEIKFKKNNHNFFVITGIGQISKMHWLCSVSHLGFSCISPVSHLSSHLAASSAWLLVKIWQLWRVLFLDSSVVSDMAFFQDSL